MRLIEVDDKTRITNVPNAGKFRINVSDFDPVFDWVTREQRI